MQAEIDAVCEAWMAFVEYSQGLGPAARKAFFLPDLVQPAGITAVADQQVLAPDAEPARDPDVDRIRLGKRSLHGLRNGKQRDRCHGNARLTDMRHGTIDRT